MKITEEVWQVGGGSLTAVEDAAIYLICFHKQAALIDAGTGKAHDRLVLNIENCGVTTSQIEYLFLTSISTSYARATSGSSGDAEKYTSISNRFFAESHYKPLDQCARYPPSITITDLVI